MQQTDNLKDAYSGFALRQGMNPMQPIGPGML
jgi:hypothetical protein